MKALLLLHLAAAMVLLGASAHASVAAWQVALRREGKIRLLRTYGSIIAVAYPVVMALGAWIYPAFRVGVRPHFDASLPWATGVFEMKEHVTALALPLVVALWACTRSHGRVPPPLLALLATVVLVVVLGAATTGALLVSLRSI